MNNVTSSQAYLALDILNAAPSNAHLCARAADILTEALRTAGWTGKTVECPEYGKAPTMADEVAQRAVAANSLIAATVAAGGTVDQVRQILMEAGGARE